MAIVVNQADVRAVPVQPATLARYRSAFTTSGAKDDPTDAEYALELLVRHRDRLTRLEPESVAMRTLRRLVEARRSLVEDRVWLTNRLTAALKAYFPQILEWFPDKDAAVFADFLERWPTLEPVPVLGRPHPVRGIALPPHTSEASRSALKFAAEQAT